MSPAKKSMLRHVADASDSTTFDTAAAFLRSVACRPVLEIVKPQSSLLTMP
jgi:hypothetical protein